ncbi:hypothetical protein JR316_0001712 [Psilocybe cubensis]|uniref:Uncharacterized protein n=2 Tax=Psilocybe cubensis TaxID=181762 RepID=A0ACB8H9X7_PSICU|nr:hypothetical protein JR316_0001712 [Psilocybe cubensis]KAH9484810.1 hypothetical protein JR316_0001712 [Psilocybe cubensis]
MDITDSMMHPEPDPNHALDALLTNNDEPSKQAVKEVHRLLVKPKQERELLDERIKLLETQLEKLKLKRITVDGTITRYNTIVSPIRRIPTDILREIFLRCLENTRNPYISAMEAPVLLTHVCRSWRAIALSSPLLWARVHIEFSNDDLVPDIIEDQIVEDEFLEYVMPRMSKSRVIEILQRRCEALEEWLRRSGACPLSFSLHYLKTQIAPVEPATTGQVNLQHSDLTHRLFNALLNESSRWSNVELSMPMDTYYALSEGFAQINFNNLVTLRVSSHGNWRWNRRRPQVNPPPSEIIAPNLQRYSFGMPQTVLQKVASPWTTLTFLSLHSAIPLSEASAILTKCSQLVHFKATLTTVHMDWIHGTHSRSRPIVYRYANLPELRALYITDQADDVLENGFFASIFAPQLSILSYYSDHSSVRFHDPALTAANLQNITQNIAQNLTQAFGHNPIHQMFAQHTTHTYQKPPICALLLKSTKLKTMILDVIGYTSSEILDVFYSASSVQRLIYGCRRTPREREHLLYEYEELDDLLTPYPIGRDLYSPTQWTFRDAFIGSENNPCTLPILPNLETLVVRSRISALSDQNLLDFIIGRMDPSPLSPFSPLKKVKVKFARKRQVDVQEGVLKYAAEKGIARKVQLDLDYSPPSFSESANLANSAISMGVKQRTNEWNYDRADEELTSIAIAKEAAK